MIRTIMVLVALAVGSTAIAQEDAYTLKSKLAHLELEKYALEENVFVPMRDGIRLSAEIRFPKGDRKNLPTVLIRSPYEPSTQARSWALRMVSFLENGYAVAFVNERGRYWSEGEYEYLVGAKEDGYDTVDWIVKQTWSNGKVGTIGCSSSAEHQLGMASQDHPGHAAAIPMAPGAGIGKMGPFLEQGNFYRGGVWQPLFFGWYYGWAWRERPFVPKEATREDRVRLSRLYDLHPKVPPVDLAKAIRHLPLQDLMPNIQGLKSPFDDFILRTPGDPKWAETDFFNEGDDYGVPTLWVFSWYDISVMPNIELFNYVRKNGTDQEVRDNQFMVISPMQHCAMGRETEQTVVGERFLGDARYDYQTLFVHWFDRWLKGEDNGVTNRPKVESYLMGKNEWRRYDGWPHPETNFVTYYLASSGDANSTLGDGRLATVKPSSSAHDTFVYNPGHPVPSLGGGFCCMGTDAVPGAFDQSYLELRRDVLVYTSEPLEEGVNVTGPIEVTLYVSSDAKDTDFAVKIVDVYPDGTAYNLDDSIQRARYREGYDKEVFMKPGEVYEVKVGPLGTSNFFESGHRIRIEVSSSNFPRYGRNLNTGGRDYDETEWKTANNSVHHSACYPSRIVLPIVPE